MALGNNRKGLKNNVKAIDRQMTELAPGGLECYSPLLEGEKLLFRRFLAFIVL